MVRADRLDVVARGAETRTDLFPSASLWWSARYPFEREPRELSTSTIPTHPARGYDYSIMPSYSSWNGVKCSGLCGH